MGGPLRKYFKHSKYTSQDKTHPSKLGDGIEESEGVAVTSKVNIAQISTLDGNECRTQMYT